MLRRLYDWCIDAAGKPHAAWLMGAVSFAESSVFPIPPDTMLIPMSLARPDKAWYFATLCTVTSVAGGLLGYFIGAVLYDSIGQWLLHIYGLGNKVDGFREAYNQYGAWIILLKGVTPIPYKLVTIVSGFARFNLFLFVVCSIVARAQDHRGAPRLLVHDQCARAGRRHCCGGLSVLSDLPNSGQIHRDHCIIRFDGEIGRAS